MDDLLLSILGLLLAIARLVVAVIGLRSEEDSAWRKPRKRLRKRKSLSRKR
jgi:hypothetical protein